MTIDCIDVKASRQLPGMRIEIAEYRFSGSTRFEHLSVDHTVSYRLISSGYFTHVWPDEGNFYRPGKLSFAPAHTRLRGRSFGERVRLAFVRFDPERFEALIDRKREWRPRELASCGNIDNPASEQLLHRLVRELLSPGLGSDLMVDALGNSLIVELARHLERLCSADNGQGGGLPPWQLGRVKRYIRESSGKVAVSNLAELCGISTGHLQRSFKKATGMTIHDYIEARRVERAKDLLTMTDESLKALAEQLGFTSQSGFSIAFKRATGETPSKFRRAVRRH